MERATWAWWKGQGGDAPISQHRRLPANHRKQGRGMEQSFSHRPQREPSLPISCSQTSSLQNSEAIDFWGLNHLPCDICYSGPRKWIYPCSVFYESEWLWAQLGTFFLVWAGSSWQRGGFSWWLSYSVACGIFVPQTWIKRRPLHWEMDS